MKKLEMKELITMLVIPACIVFAVLTLGMCVGYAQESVSYIEWFVKGINSNHDAYGKQAVDLCKQYKIDTRDSQGNPLWDCRSRCAVAAQMLKDNGYEFRRATSECPDGTHHIYIEVKDEASRWWPILNVWSIDKAN